ncbi:MAG: TraB/GumN family protein, partial [Bacteroidota bacterium]
GTVHVGDERAYNFHPEVLPALERAEGMAGELTFDMAMMIQAMSAMIMKDSTLADLLPEEKYNFVHKKIEDRVGPLMTGMVEVMKPAIIPMMLIDPETLMSADVTETQREPLDLYFQNKAREAEKEVTGLETVQEQMAAFEVYSLKEQAEMLYESLKAEEQGGEEGSMEKELNNLLDIYESEDLDSLYALTVSELDPMASEQLLNVRNIRMADRFEKLMERKTWFVAVGAAHLPGEKGVIQLMRDKGYTVKPLSEKKE